MLFHMVAQFSRTFSDYQVRQTGGAVAEWVRAFDWRPRGPGFESCLSEETLSGVYARGSQISHQSTLEMCNLSWTLSLLEKDNSGNNCVQYTSLSASLYRKETKDNNRRIK